MSLLATFKYSVLIDKSVKISVTQQNQFKRLVRTCLKDPDGWAKFGILFLECQSSQQKTRDQDTIDFIITLASDRKIQQVCNLAGLSCYDPITYQIPHLWINYTNWMGGAHQSGLSLPDYRTYVINHEVGHFLGLDHPAPNQRCGVDGIASVMNQMTLGRKAIEPCLIATSKPVKSRYYIEPLRKLM